MSMVRSMTSRPPRARGDVADLAAGQLTVEDGALGPQLCCGSSGFFQLAAAQHDAGLRGLALLGDFGHGFHVVGLAQRSQLGKAALAVPQALVEARRMTFVGEFRLKYRKVRSK